MQRASARMMAQQCRKFSAKPEALTEVFHEPIVEPLPPVGHTNPIGIFLAGSFCFVSTVPLDVFAPNQEWASSIRLNRIVHEHLATKFPAYESERRLYPERFVEEEED